MKTAFLIIVYTAAIAVIWLFFKMMRDAVSDFKKDLTDDPESEDYQPRDYNDIF
jgi:hypothetical protein